jgi:hypothetical protein
LQVFDPIGPFLDTEKPFFEPTENQTSLSEQIRVANSVADPGCLSRIPDPKTATKEKKLLSCRYLFL